MQIILKPLPEIDERLCNRIFFNFKLHFVLLLAAQILFSIPVAALESEKRNIALNEAVEILLPEEAVSVLIGNPDIADILTQTDMAVFLTGKRAGRTNLLVRNRDQKSILDIALNVVPADQLPVTIYRGPTRIDYSCSPTCRVIAGPPATEPVTSVSAKQSGSAE